MIGFTWELFSQTGNIETYLLLKELEKGHYQENGQKYHNDKSINTNM
ncbi:YqzL family protein [Lentibacillus kimchii]|uniref:YqzL family protein n=1 Tax=Lentibacillus kimchii TaxID=1542911 RepID=A0ABW2UYL3_9BACI